VSLNLGGLGLKVRKFALFSYEVVQWYSFTHQSLSGVEFEDEKIVVANSVLDVKPGYQWRSFSMGLHAPMVFFGLFRMGPIDSHFVYGQPWTTEYSLVRAVLLEYRKQLSMNPVQIYEIYEQGLVEAKVPFKSLWLPLVRLFGPRNANGIK